MIPILLLCLLLLIAVAFGYTLGVICSRLSRQSRDEEWREIAEEHAARLARFQEMQVEDAATIILLTRRAGVHQGGKEYKTVTKAVYFAVRKQSYGRAA